MRALTVVGLVAATAGSLACGNPAEAPDPAVALAELLAQDRAFASAAASTELVDAVAPMFATGVLVAVPGRGWVEGREPVLAALRDNPANAGARIEWAPIRGGVSADGQHGFTFGYMSQHQADGSTRLLKYLSYWIRDSTGWRVLGWKRGLRPEGAVAMNELPPFLPEAGVVPTGDATTIEGFRAALVAAEQAFSDEAQRIGLGAAFAQWGRSDAVNMGGPGSAEWVIGAQAIGAQLSRDDTSTTSPVHWKADRTFVASSGDLGINFGMIRGHAGGDPFPFFTVWARESPDAEWRYIAE